LGMKELDPTVGWYTLKSGYWHMYRIAPFLGWCLAGLFVIPEVIWGDLTRTEAVALFIVYCASMPALHFLIWWSISYVSTRHNRFYKIPFDSALARIEELLEAEGEECRKSLVDEQWFGRSHERAGISREILKWKEGRPMVVLELSRGRYIAVAEHPWKDLIVSGITVWPVKGEAMASLEALKHRIDQALGAPAP